MAYATKYRCEFDTIKGNSVKIDIEEDAFAGSITNLIASGESPLIIDAPNAEFDKLTGVRESQIRLTILGGDTGVVAADFLSTSDTQYKVKIYINSVVEWVGWLDNDKLIEQFQDGKYDIELTGTDGLSLIKNIELSNLSDAQIWGIDTVKKYIAYCLDKTDLGLDYWSFINCYPVLESGGSLFDVDQRGVDNDFDLFYYANITSFTFLTGPRNFDDCYTVLSKIMEAMQCTLFQARGKWYVIHLNDRIANDLDGTLRDATGAALSIATNQSFAVNVGLNQDVKLVNADAVVSWNKANKDVKLAYEFKMPPVFFRNWDLLDGTFNAPLSTSARPVYSIDNWTENVGDTYIGIEVDTATTAELVRYILQYPVVTYSNGTVQPAASTTVYYINENDKISFGYSTREKNAGFVVTSQFNYVILTDGITTYYLDDDGKWYTSIKAIGKAWAGAEDRRFWADYSIQSEAVPISGQIYVKLTAIGNSRTASNEVHYKDLDFTITTYFNEKLTVSGYENKSSQTAKLKNSYDNQLYVSNSDNIGTQGAILKSTYGQFAGYKYYSAASSTQVSFAKFMTRVAWKALYRNYIKFEGTLLNIYSTGNLLSLLNTITFDEIADKEFMITTISNDIRNETAEVRLIELRDTSDTDDFTQVGTEAFRYLNVREEVFNDIPEQKKPLDWRGGIYSVAMQLIIRRKRRNFNNYSS
mgnify:CR=1 FL=1